MFDLRIIISIALIFIGNWLGLRMIPGGKMKIPYNNMMMMMM
jgi:hypothetical protein